MEKKVKDKFRKVKLLILDVDGVLTNGNIIYDDKDRELKMFHVSDGLGVYVLTHLGIPAIFLTARDSKIVRRRAKDMGVSEVIGGVIPKESMLEKIKKKYKVKTQDICFIGDDLIDVGMMKKVGLPVAPQNAAGIVKKFAAYVTKKEGGQGAVREVVDIILREKKLLGKALALFNI